MQIKCERMKDMTTCLTDNKKEVRYMLSGESADVDQKDVDIVEKYIQQSSKDRKKVICPIFYTCGGCDFLHTTYDYQLKLKEKHVESLYKKLGLFHQVVPIIKSDEPLHYRHKTVLSATTKKNKLRLGLYQEKSKTITPFLECYIHDKKANEVFKTIEQLLNQFKISAYDIDKKQGIIKHVMIRKSYARDDMMVVFVTQGSLFPNAKKISQMLVKKHPQVKTTIQNIHNKDTHLVLLEQEKTIYGSGYIIDQIDDLSFKLSPRSFYQVNPMQMQKLYQKAIDVADIKKTDIVIDTYSGIGTLSLLIAKKAKQVYAIEVNKDAHQDALDNKKYNQIQNIDFIHGDVSENMFKITSSIDVLFMDPTRDGASIAFLDDVMKLKPKKIVYISCEPKTQVRDVNTLSQLYDIKQIQPVDMFSQTVHVESIVLLSLKTS
jgi:23S rRNA (uracil1939-C5)-methyltransferase